MGDVGGARQPSLRRHILLVDDNDGDIELVRDAVSGLEVELEVSGNGEEALARLRSPDHLPPPDFVLLDLKLPRMGGLELLDEVSRDPSLRRIPFVVLTSSQAPADLARAYTLGARACFAKPPTGPHSLIVDILAFMDRVLPVPPTSIRVAPSQERTKSDDSVRARQTMAMVASAADAIIGATIDGTIISWNRGAQQLFGHSSAESIGRNIRIIVPEARREEIDDVIRCSAAGTPVQHMRTVRALPDGRSVHVALTVSPVWESRGHVFGISAIARDITELVHAKARFRLAVEASPSAMLMVAETGDILMLNAEAERLFGYPRDELIGQPVQILIPERMRATHPEFRRRFAQQPQVRAMGAGRELFGLRRDGTEVPVEIGLNPIETAEGPVVLCSIVDISERRWGEEKFRLAVEASPNGIVMVDDDGIIVLVNAETERMFGYSPGELTGSAIERLVPLRFQGQHVHHRRDFTTAPEARAMGTGRDLHGLRKEGREFPVEVGLNPITTPQGRFVLCTIVDITARKQAELVLARQAEELARSNEELEQFAYVASHDLQEPLRMVSSYTALLADRYGENLDDAAHRYIHFAQDGATRMRGLIDDLLAFSRVRSRGREIVATNAASALERALHVLHIAIDSSGARIDTQVDADVLADTIQLTQVFQNLISNSLKFRAEAPPELVITSHREGATVTFGVRDNGIGISPEHAERVFQMFQRLHTREAYEGTGIGLALCRRIVERHGGKIWIESDGVDGSTVLFTLQAAEGGAA